MTTTNDMYRYKMFFANKIKIKFYIIQYCLLLMRRHQP